MEITQRTGLSGLAPLVALTSEESHYSIVKVAKWRSIHGKSSYILYFRERTGSA